ncbi:hypothetical protein QJS10_CPA03g00989 [Acorus calamus]|uniref:Uncharacterized protein n=1 Tax=Acorus calamus TaxID=4465 RepID=A0AAV9F9K0_ACOCL|nr:hypothetical protein QJS10_CPA03g00989 [Acorus calamus]
MDSPCLPGVLQVKFLWQHSLKMECGVSQLDGLQNLIMFGMKFLNLILVVVAQTFSSGRGAK